MGAPTLQGLTPLEARTVTAFYGEANGNKTKALEIAGGSDPHGNAPKIFNRPRPFVSLYLSPLTPVDGML